MCIGQADKYLQNSSIRPITHETPKGGISELTAKSSDQHLLGTQNIFVIRFSTLQFHLYLLKHS